jgi:Fe-S cluster biosynthesis and repair protein YggX
MKGIERKFQNVNREWQMEKIKHKETKINEAKLEEINIELENEIEAKMVDFGIMKGELQLAQHKTRMSKLFGNYEET